MVRPFVADGICYGMGSIRRRSYNLIRHFLAHFLTPSKSLRCHQEPFSKDTERPPIDCCAPQIWPKLSGTVFCKLGAIQSVSKNFYLPPSFSCTLTHTHRQAHTHTTRSQIHTHTHAGTHALLAHKHTRTFSNKQNLSMLHLFLFN